MLKRAILGVLAPLEGDGSGEEGEDEVSGGEDEEDEFDDEHKGQESEDDCEVKFKKGKPREAPLGSSLKKHAPEGKEKAKKHKSSRFPVHSIPDSTVVDSLDLPARLHLVTLAAVKYSSSPYATAQLLQSQERQKAAPSRAAKLPAPKKRRLPVAEAAAPASADFGHTEVQSASERKKMTRASSFSDGRQRDADAHDDQSTDSEAGYDFSSLFAYSEPREGEEEPPTFRGKFHCKLCPAKVLMFEEDLEKHILSKDHRRREAQWESELQRQEDVRRLFNRRIDEKRMRQQSEEEEDEIGAGDIDEEEASKVNGHPDRDEGQPTGDDRRRKRRGASESLSQRTSVPSASEQGGDDVGPVSPLGKKKKRGGKAAAPNLKAQTGNQGQESLEKSLAAATGARKPRGGLEAGQEQTKNQSQEGHGKQKTRAGKSDQTKQKKPTRSRKAKARTRVANLTQEQITRRKEAFARKKALRMQRKQQIQQQQ
eukprot:GHVT01074159.1.p1 GENE.GHVT01074159.1~~GHVT01074159.1.p1  ORF type:complete len:483 (-),score=135.16 GHVT01074159.1:910-2358(-)